MARAREALRGITSSPFAPAALLAAALVVAVGGSGADALSSLGQLATGPAVPLSPVESVSRGAPAGADVSELDSGVLASADSAKRRASRSASKDGARRSRGGAGGPSRPASVNGGSGGSSGDRSGGGTTGSGGGTTPAPATPRTPSSGQAPSGNSAPTSPTRPNPLGETLDQTQQQLDELLQPVKPITDEVLGGLGR